MSFLNSPADVRPAPLALSRDVPIKRASASAYNANPSWLATDALMWVVLLAAAGILDLLFSVIAAGVR